MRLLLVLVILQWYNLKSLLVSRFTRHPIDVCQKNWSRWKKNWLTWRCVLESGLRKKNENKGLEHDVLYIQLSEYRCSTIVWSNTNIKHANEKNKTKLGSGPIFRVVHQSLAKCRHFGNFNFYKVLYGEWQALPIHFVCHPKPHKNYNFQIDGAPWYFDVWLWQLVHLLIFLCSFQWCVFFLCVWPSFIGAVLSVIKVYFVYFSFYCAADVFVTVNFTLASQLSFLSTFRDVKVVLKISPRDCSADWSLSLLWVLFNLYFCVSMLTCFNNKNHFISFGNSAIKVPFASKVLCPLLSTL